MATFVVGSGVGDGDATITLTVMDADWFKSALFGALFELTIRENWIEMGDVDVGLAVEEAAKLIDTYAYSPPPP